MRHRFFATAAQGLAPLLAEELTALGATGVKLRPAGAAFSGDMETAYRACLWSRVASRVLLPLATVRAESADALYDGARTILWREHLSFDGTLAVDCTGSAECVGPAHYAAQRVKDAVADQFRDAIGVRPSVDRRQPDVRINAHLRRDHVTISIDLSGESLHRRGYRLSGSKAPLRETLAAGMLLRCGWPALAAGGAALLDPMCGSGTLPVEAAAMAADCAPGLQRAHWGFLRWRGFDRALWARLLTEARARRETGFRRVPPIYGFDADRAALHASDENTTRAGFGGRIELARRTVHELEPPPGARPGLVIANPPYGVRIGELRSLGELYRDLGMVLKARFAGWQVAVLTPSPELGKCLGLRIERRNPFYNGAIRVELLRSRVR